MEFDIMINCAGCCIEDDTYDLRERARCDDFDLRGIRRLGGVRYL